MNTYPRRGFTLVDSAASAAGLAGVVALGALALGSQPGGQRDRQQMEKDATQIRAIQQAMVVWAQNNQDRYPLPSLIDKQDATVKEKDRAKDTTANILSLLIYNGMIDTAVLVSPFEVNEAVAPHESYEFDRPRAAVTPEQALWDPSLKASLGPAKGHISYAHLQPAGKRLDRWSNTFVSDEAVAGTRGPEIENATAQGEAVVPTFAKATSNSLRILGDGTVWSGHIAFNDNHVEFLSGLAHQKPYTTKLTYASADGRTKHGRKRPDILFYDEPDDAAASANTYLGIFTKAGVTPQEFKTIWD
jgi:hypothetical protein